MLIHSASQLLTLAGGPQRGRELGKLGIIKDGALLLRGETIEATGTTQELIKKYPNEPRLDAGHKVVMPGFVDPHTHLIWAGQRAEEFEWKLQGKSYLEILAAGGGILSTVKETKKASLDELVNQTRKRAWSLLSQGTTTAEVKTGYGLDTKSELRQLEGILCLDNEGPLEMIPTFLGAHAIPPEYKNNSDAFTDLICCEMIPEVFNWWNKNAEGRKTAICGCFL